MEALQRARHNLAKLNRVGKKMATILVTGATGNLGSAVVRALLARGHRVRALARSRNAKVEGAEIVCGDLKLRDSLAGATAGVAAIIHCASSFDADGATDLQGTSNLVDAARLNARPRLIYISIVGVDRIDFPYFKTKLSAEAIVRRSGLPYTILRAAQFHDFVLRFVQSFEDKAQRTITVPKGLFFQSIAVEEVAERLASAVASHDVGYCSEMAGPEILRLEAMAERYARSSVITPTVTTLADDPEPAFHDAFRSGHGLVPDSAVGRQTWEQFLKERFGAI